MKRSVLYISYDGLLDPLGKSQIYPYINSIARSSDSFHIVSFEKKIRYTNQSEYLIKIKSDKNISWNPLIFSEKFGILAKIFDLTRMLLTSLYLVAFKDIKILHARGHPSALTAYLIKNFFFWKELKFIFDFRGLWVDERVEKGGWNLTKSFDYIQFKIFKKLERLMLRSASSIVVLTHRLKRLLPDIAESELNKIYVIPCCADFNHFRPISPNKKKELLLSLGIPEGSFVLGYVGSIGSMYDIASFFNLFEKAQLSYKECFGLILTNDVYLAEEKYKEYLPEKLYNKVLVMSLDRNQIPDYFSLMSVSTIFLNDSYARLGTSPTKFGESLALGIPVIASKNIGDLDLHIDELNAGLSIDLKDDTAISLCFNYLIENQPFDSQSIRHNSQAIYDLNSANKTYELVYKNL